MPKYCPSCQTDKALNHFYKLKSSPDGLQRACKACQQKQNAKRPGSKSKPKGERGVERYHIVRNTSRQTGLCSWGIIDNSQNANAVIHIADNLKQAILELNRLNTPAEKLKYTKHGMVGYIDPEAEDTE
jgi:hypothetical protein